MLLATDQRLIRELAPWSGIAGQVLMCLALPSFTGTFDEMRLCSQSGLPETQNAAVLELLRRLCELGLVTERSNLRWEVTAEAATFLKFARLLEAIDFYKEQVHRDETTARVVLTRPGQPSKLEDTLNAMGFVTGHMEMTSEVFGDIAFSARERLVVMTPFLDRHGAGWLSELLRKAKPQVRKVVILRYLKDPSHLSYPDGFITLAPTLTELAVEVFDYAVPRSPGAGMETFHAKVVLADDNYAYVGSANVNRASLEHSMELGLLVRGEAARTIAKVIEAIMQICTSRM